MEPQEQVLRERIQGVIDGAEAPPVFVAWFEDITWLIRPPHMRPLPFLVALVTSRCRVLSKGLCTPAEFRQSLAYVVATVDKTGDGPLDPLRDRLPAVSTPKMRGVKEG